MQKDSTDAYSLLTQLISANFTVKALYAAAYHGIADHIKDGKNATEDLAKATGCDASSLYRILRLLSATGLFREEPDGRFELTPFATPLCSGPGSLRPMILWLFDPRHDALYGSFSESVRTGEPSVRLQHGVPLFEYFAHHPEHSETFNLAMTSSAALVHAAAASLYDFSQYQTVCDVGGGHGSLIQAILSGAPSVSGVLYDLPHVVEGGKASLDAVGLSSRCEVIAGNFFEKVPQADVHVLSHVLHDWNDEQARIILRNCHRAQPNDGRVVVLEMLVGPENEPDLAKAIDIEMLALTGGRERTETEFARLFQSAGFELIQVTATLTPVSLLAARRR